MPAADILISVTIEGVLVVVAVVTLLIAAAGVVGGQFRISRNATAIKITTEIAQAWENKAKVQEQQIHDLELSAAKQSQQTTAALAAKDAEIAELRARVEVLQDLVTGKSAVENLAQDHKRLEGKISETLQQVGIIRTDLRKALEARPA
jgi:Tfp pilus assembly protein PilX